MSDAQRHDHHDEQFDAEIDVRRIGWFLVWLSVGAIVTCVLMYALFRDFQAREERADQPSSPLVDRSRPQLPPEPRLQIEPEKDLARHREAQAALLSTYGWVDEPLGIVRIPIDRAIDLVAAQKLPSRAATPPLPRAVGGIPAASRPLPAAPAAAQPAHGDAHGGHP